MWACVFSQPPAVAAGWDGGIGSTASSLIIMPPRCMLLLFCAAALAASPHRFISSSLHRSVARRSSGGPLFFSIYMCIYFCVRNIFTRQHRHRCRCTGAYRRRPVRAECVRVCEQSDCSEKRTKKAPPLKMCAHQLPFVTLYSPPFCSHASRTQPAITDKQEVARPLLLRDPAALLLL